MRSYVIVIASVVLLIVVDVLLWLAIGWTTVAQVQAAFASSASALIVAGLGIAGTVVGVWRTHENLMSKERLFRFQDDKRRAYSSILSFADQYQDALKAAHEPASTSDERAQASRRVNDLRSMFLEARYSVALLTARQDVRDAVNSLASRIKDGTDHSNEASQLIAAAKLDLGIAE